MTNKETTKKKTATISESKTKSPAKKKTSSKTATKTNAKQHTIKKEEVVKKTPVKKELIKEEIVKEFPRRENDCWIFIMLLSTLAILAAAINNYTFSVDNINLSISIFIAPFLYFLANFITKKYGVYKTIQGIILSGLALFLFIIIINFMVGLDINYMETFGQYLGYIVSQFVNLAIYYYLLDNASEDGFFTYLTFIFAVVVNNLIFMIFSFNSVVTDTFWLEYFGSLIFEMIVFIPLAFTDSQIERGL